MGSLKRNERALELYFSRCRPILQGMKHYPAKLLIASGGLCWSFDGVNLILFNEPFQQVRLAAADTRAQHIRRVLRAELGTRVFIGFVNGLRARAEVHELAADGASVCK